MIEKLFQDCGLSPGEQTIFLALLSHGSTLASILAKQTNIKRPSVYASLERLCDYGLVHKIKKGGVTYFSPVAIDMIPEILQDHEDRLYEEKKNISSLALLLPTIPISPTTEMAGVSLSALDTHEAVYLGLKKLLIQGDFLSIFNPQEIFQNSRIKQLALEFLQETGKKNSPIREIVVQGPLTTWYKQHINNPHRQIREIGANFNIRSEIFIVENKVVFCDYVPPPEIMITVERTDFSETMRTIFDLLWNSIS